MAGSNPRHFYVKDTMSRIVIFTRSQPSCEFCSQAKALLVTNGYGYSELDVVNMAHRVTMKATLPQARTVPQIVVNDHHIGGYLELVASIASGEFARLERGEPK